MKKSPVCCKKTCIKWLVFNELTHSCKTCWLLLPDVRLKIFFCPILGLLKTREILTFHSFFSNCTALLCLNKNWIMDSRGNCVLSIAKYFYWQEYIRVIYSTPLRKKNFKWFLKWTYARTTILIKMPWWHGWLEELDSRS